MPSIILRKLLFILLAVLSSTLPIHGQSKSFKTFIIDDLYGIKSPEGKVILEPKYEYISDFYSQPLSCFQRKKTLSGGRTFGILDTNGEVILDCVLKFCVNFRDPYFVLINNQNKQGLMNRKGQLLLPIEYDKVQLFSNNRALIKRHDKFGFADTNGKIQISIKYDSASSFSCNRALVKLNSKYAYLDTKGDLICDFLYDDGSSFFVNDRAIINQNGKFGIIDLFGKIEAEPIYDTLVYLRHQKLYRGLLNGKTIFIQGDKNSRSIANCDFQIIGIDSLNFEQISAQVDSLNLCSDSEFISNSKAFDFAKRLNFEKAFDLEDEYNSYFKYFKSRMDNICVWVFIGEKLEFSREGECALTNGCSVIVKRTLILNASSGEPLYDKTDKHFIPNFE